jgi:hypothetical protein
MSVQGPKFEGPIWNKNVGFTCERIMLTFYFILFSHFSHGSFIVLLLNTHTMDEHRHKIFVTLFLIITMQQVIGISLFLASFAFKKFITLFKFQIWKKKSLQNFIKTSTTKVSSKLEFNLFFSYFLQIQTSSLLQLMKTSTFHDQNFMFLFFKHLYFVHLQGLEMCSFEQQPDVNL